MWFWTIFGKSSCQHLNRCDLSNVLLQSTFLTAVFVCHQNINSVFRKIRKTAWECLWRMSWWRIWRGAMRRKRQRWRKTKRRWHYWFIIPNFSYVICHCHLSLFTFRWRKRRRRWTLRTSSRASWSLNRSLAFLAVLNCIIGYVSPLSNILTDIIARRFSPRSRLWRRLQCCTIQTGCSRLWRGSTNGR